MGIYGASDLDGMLSEFGVPVELVKGGGTVCGSGIVDKADEDLLPTATGALAGRVKTVLVKASAFSELAAGDPLKVDGAEVRVTFVRLEDDGAMVRAWFVGE